MPENMLRPVTKGPPRRRQAHSMTYLTGEATGATGQEAGTLRLLRNNFGALPQVLVYHSREHFATEVRGMGKQDFMAFPGSSLNRMQVCLTAGWEGWDICHQSFHELNKDPSCLSPTLKPVQNKEHLQKLNNVILLPFLLKKSTHSDSGPASTRTFCPKRRRSE